MQSLQESFRQINANHRFEVCVDPQEIDRLEAAIGLPMPSDLKAFYQAYRTVGLYVHSMGPTYRLVPVSEIRLTRLDILGSYDEEALPNAWYTVCDVLDGNYVAVDLKTRTSSPLEANYIDCFHESFAMPGESRIVARSFTEFLSNALQSKGEVAYFLQRGFVGYGDAVA